MNRVSARLSFWSSAQHHLSIFKRPVILAALVLAATALAVGGCGKPKTHNRAATTPAVPVSNPQDANDENFRTAVSAYLDAQAAAAHGYCFGSAGYPRQVSQFVPALYPLQPSNPEIAAALRLGLIRLSRPPQLVRVLGIAIEPRGSGTYSFTSVGEAAFIPGLGFCAGTPYLLAIYNWTQPTAQNGSTVSDVVFLYSFKDVPQWAQSATGEEVIRNLFGGAPPYTESPRTAHATLILTGNGWVEHGLFGR